MADTFKTHSRSLTSPPEDAVVIAPNNVGELAHVTRAVYVGGTGNLAVLMYGGATVTLISVPGGTFLPLRVRQVLGTGTTATDIVGFW